MLCPIIEGALVYPTQFAALAENHMTSTNTENTLAELLRQANRALSEAADQAGREVLQQSDNPAITRIGDGQVKMFRISMSELSKPKPRAGYDHPPGGRQITNFTPFFHDWKSQYEHVADLLQQRRFAAVAEILDDGRHSEPGELRHFAPEVVTKLQGILGDLRDALDESSVIDSKPLKTPRPGR